MSSINITPDQHRLVTNRHGQVIVIENSFRVYDTLSKTTIDILLENYDLVVNALCHQPGIVIDEASTSSGSPCSSSAQSAELSPAQSETSYPKNVDMEIWKKNAGKASPIDLRARDDLISLVGSPKYQKMLKDKTTTKTLVFKEIAKELLQKGYSFGDRDGSKVCHQKWKNMESETLKVLAAGSTKNSGGGAAKKPDYFDDVFDIVKDDAKATPKNLLDSFKPEEESAEVGEASGQTAEAETEKTDDPSVPEDNGGEGTSQGNRSSPFLKVKLSSKPQQKKRVSTNEILSFLKEDAAKKDVQNENILKFWKKKAKGDDKRKKSLINVLEKLAGSNKKKKTVSSEEVSSNSSSDDDIDS